MKRTNPWTMPLIVTGLLVAGIAAYLNYERTPTGNIHEQRLKQLLAQRVGWSDVHLSPYAKVPTVWYVGGTKHGIEFRGQCDNLDPDTLAFWVYLTRSRPGLDRNGPTIAALFFGHPIASWAGQPLPPGFLQEMTGLANELHEALTEVVDAPPRPVQFPSTLRVQTY